MQLVGRRGKGEEQLAQWNAQDALVLKWVALRIGGLLPTHARCAHLKGHGGAGSRAAGCQGTGEWRV
ncbi:hypothetical protein D4100_22695 [Serratia inhibens]|uniref:Uncharacterized protein n=2 Tax=Serratia inhibens TaxID=2338073 RepID=A0AA92X0Y9_9GAMM|nr:hypothetical protein D4100_22695 [Serratia inhibens]